MKNFLFVVLMTLLPLAADAASPGSQDFGAGNFRWTVPDGVTSLDINAQGGVGGSGGGCGSFSANSGTVGQILVKQVAVQPGAILEISIAAGGTGNPGSDRGGGGGGGGGFVIVSLLDPSTMQDVQIINLDGGGGGGGAPNGNGGDGGSAGSSGFASWQCGGGDGSDGDAGSVSINW